MTAALVEPTLTQDELDQLLDLARRPDALGVLPSDTDWEPTWLLEFAAAEGWRWKAGKVSFHFDFSTDQQSFERSQVYDHCMQQAALYDAYVAQVEPLVGRRGVGSTPTHRYEDLSALDAVGNIL